MYISVPVWILSTITENFQTVVNKKHECDTQRISSNAYKKARIVKQYHLTSVSTHKDYEPETTTPTSSSQEGLWHICNKYLKPVQVTVQQTVELTRAIMDKIHPSKVFGSN